MSALSQNKTDQTVLTAQTGKDISIILKLAPANALTNVNAQETKYGEIFLLAPVLVKESLDVELDNISMQRTADANLTQHAQVAHYAHVTQEMIMIIVGLQKVEIITGLQEVEITGLQEAEK